MTPNCNLKSRANTQRYGQCHMNFLWLLGLASHKNGINKITPLGSAFLKLNIHEQTDVFTKLLFRIPLIRNIYREDIIDANNAYIYASSMRESVIKRRLPTVRKLIEEINYQINNGGC